MTSREVIYEALVDVFERSPVAICIATCEYVSRYVMVNPAYLQLIGKGWEEIAGQPLVLDTVRALDDPNRLRRRHMLETAGHFQLEEVDLLHASGRIVPTLISTQRRVINGEPVDIEIIIDNSERKAFERSILEAAFTDVMTGLPNRAAFDSRLGAMTAPERTEGALGLAFLDLNGFKTINDRYGHRMGDALLRVVADRLRTSMRSGDFVARLGGDEFGVLFDLPAEAPPADPAARFRPLAQDICRDIRIEGHALPIGAAVGVAVATRPADGESLLHLADSLMYAAKATGRPIEVFGQHVSLMATGPLR
ncbi:sensor domain-containing diguanylate cyclase [Ancylobacter sp. 6x-1]|uniref:Sensor domain-containing diguanylate cyclase n=1 Tax=Ancylobacter crimeensis TaxID=2579147 RepID=A0ABT0D8X0_9HYPH|nr:sensor domain-containing diguanylate cyclase [Ancylobacter crimeensis]MCK0196403.1 sensor domain-containing diguanylate cyclase [Ancylobacter crimeensis]